MGTFISTFLFLHSVLKVVHAVVISDVFIGGVSYSMCCGYIFLIANSATHYAITKTCGLVHYGGRSIICFGPLHGSVHYVVLSITIYLVLL